MPPYRYEAYDPSRFAGSIGELLMRRGDIEAARAAQIANAQAQAAQARGDAWAGAVSNIGQIAGHAITTYAKEQQEAPARARQAEMDRLQLDEARSQAEARKAAVVQDRAISSLFAGGRIPSPQELMQAAGPERGTKIAQGISAFQELQTKKVTDARDTAGRLAIGAKSLPQDALARVWPGLRQAAIAGGLGDEESIPTEPAAEYLDAVIGWASGKDPAKVGTREVKVRNADGSETIQIVKDEPGQTFASAAPEPKTYPVVVRGPNGQPVRKLATEAELKAGVEEFREDKGAPARFWVMRNGQPLRVTEEQYRAGDLPANIREQGRPVTSGDAGRVADFDTSMDDLRVLGDALSVTDSTGFRAKLGAGTWNWVTEVTGWGSDAKKKQALIDRVKQVIGKTLEGGVLRKEDEVKYEKILPTIGDPNELVVSKLAGLSTAIKQRRTRFLESLGDAGYDTTKYNARTGGTGKIRARDPQGNIHEAAAGTPLPQGWELVN